MKAESSRFRWFLVISGVVQLNPPKFQVKFQVSSFKFYLSHTRLYRDCITSSEMRVGSAPWTVQI